MKKVLENALKFDYIMKFIVSFVCNFNENLLLLTFSLSRDFIISIPLHSPSNVLVKFQSLISIVDV